MVALFPFIPAKEKKESVPAQISLTIEEPQPPILYSEEPEEERVVIIEILGD